MGHFYSKNVSELAIELFKTHDRLTFADMVGVMKGRGETIHAAEGEYDEDYMLYMGVEQLFVGYHQHCDCIEPCPETKEQYRVWQKFEDEDDLEEEEYGILNTIEWQTTGEDMPVIDYIPS